tara:strand:+ start:206 stop:430 length:225 start_codon:yes stop_codon:yes gene_type:complete
MSDNLEKMIKEHFGEDVDVEKIIFSMFDVFKDIIDFLNFIQMREEYMAWVEDKQGYKIKHYTKQKIKPIYPKEN